MKPQKNNIRSFRFSDEVYAVLERQDGKNLNDKFEELVLYCSYKIPKIDMQLQQKKKELAELENKILEAKVKLNNLNDLQNMKHNISNTIMHLSLQAIDFQDGLKKIM